MKQYILYSLLIIINNNLLGMETINSDDIEASACWIESPHQLLPVHLPNNSVIAVSQRHFYRPHNTTNMNDLIVCTFIHNKALENTNNYQQYYNNLKRFATWYATIKCKNLELLSCQYTEPWSDDKQMQAGKQLHNILTQSYPDAETVFLGHGNGANINNYISRITPSEKPINLMVHLSCPRKKDENYQPLNYKNLLYFYSDNDGTETPYELHMIHSILHIIRTLCIAPCLALGTILELNNISRTFLSPLVYLPIKLLTPKESILAEGTHDFLNLNEKITVGFRTQINEKSPIDIIDTLQFLPEIIEQTLQQYPYHYAKSNGFYLNINNKKNNNNPLHIVLRKKILNDLSSPSMPQAIDYLVCNNNVNNIIKPRSFLSLDNEDTEKRHSIEEAERYKN